MNKFRRLSFCPHCSNETQQELVYNQEKETPIGYPKDTRSATFVTLCSTCQSILLYAINEVLSPDLPITDLFLQSSLVWPEIGLKYSIPNQVEHIYTEALRIKHIAPNAFAVQIRRALEAVCVDQGAPSGPLYKKLKWLSDQNKIPYALAEMGEILRLLGNIGAHPDFLSVHPSLVSILDDFFQVITAHLYDDPIHKLYQLEMQLDHFRKTLEPNSELTGKVIEWLKKNPDIYNQAMERVAYWKYSPNEVDFEKFVEWMREKLPMNFWLSPQDVEWGNVFAELFI